jgi:hypothetical protein
MITGESLFAISLETSTSILVSIGQFMGDATNEILTTSGASAAHSYLFRQTKRPRPTETISTPYLPLDYRFLEPLFEAVFRWNPAERISVNAISTHPFFRNARPCYELPLARFPEIGQNPSL